MKSVLTPWGLTLVGLLLLSACGTRAVRMNTMVYPPKLTAEEVEIFTDTKPTRPYIELATMHNDSGNYEDIVTGFRRKAQQMGADAIIIKMAETHLVPGWFSNTQQQTAYATAIKYKDTPGK